MTFENCQRVCACVCVCLCVFVSVSVSVFVFVCVSLSLSLALSLPLCVGWGVGGLGGSGVRGFGGSGVRGLGGWGVRGLGGSGVRGFRGFRGLGGWGVGGASVIACHVFVCVCMLRVCLDGHQTSVQSRYLPGSRICCCQPGSRSILGIYVPSLGAPPDGTATSSPLYFESLTVVLSF